MTSLTEMYNESSDICGTECVKVPDIYRFLKSLCRAVLQMFKKSLIDPQTNKMHVLEVQCGGTNLG
jgi:hypothetical protein